MVAPATLANFAITRNKAWANEPDGWRMSFLILKQDGELDFFSMNTNTRPITYRPTASVSNKKWSTYIHLLVPEFFFKQTLCFFSNYCYLYRFLFKIAKFRFKLAFLKQYQLTKYLEDIAAFDLKRRFSYVDHNCLACLWNTIDKMSFMVLHIQVHKVGHLNTNFESRFSSKRFPYLHGGYIFSMWSLSTVIRSFAIFLA